jgi:hypothetical protein
MKKETDYQSNLIKKLEKMFPNCIVLKNDPSFIQGIPDLIILYKDRWACLECKREDKAHKQPNQPWYVNELNKMSYCSFIYPENEEEILDELQRALRP